METIKKLYSGEMTDGIINAGNRVLLYATGIGREEMQRRLPELQEAIEKKKAKLAARQE